MTNDERRRLRAAHEREAVVAVTLGQPWVEAWTGGVFEEVPEAVEWLRSRPAAVKEMLVRFPPSCLVRTRHGRTLRTPAPGTVGIVTSYYEDGSISVRQAPDSQVRAECDPDDLVVVGYYRGLSPERVRKILDGGRSDETRKERP